MKHVDSDQWRFRLVRVKKNFERIRKPARKIYELENELLYRKRQQRREKCKKRNKEEMRLEDRKEMTCVCVAAACVVMYACIALVIKDSFDLVVM